jgi:cell division protein FtsI (penicillin-binding protein 3)
VFSRITEGTLRTLGVAPDMPLTPLQLARRGADEAASAGVGRENM